MKKVTVFNALFLGMLVFTLHRILKFINTENMVLKSQYLNDLTPKLTETENQLLVATSNENQILKFRDTKDTMKMNPKFRILNPTHTEKYTSMTSGTFKEHINIRATSLTSAKYLLPELQQRSVDIFTEYIGNNKKAVLFDMANIENKGDPAISLGELNLLAKLNISLLTYCSYICSEGDMFAIRQMLDNQKLGPEDVVVLSSGGGNFGGYRFNDYKRASILNFFPEYDFFLFSQSTWFDFDDGTHLRYVKKAYAAHNYMTAFLRDRESLQFTREEFPNIQSVLAPDMAFNIDPVARFFPAMFDIVWIHRTDPESPGEMIPRFPAGISYVMEDWFFWPSPRGQHLIDRTYMMTYNGFLFLQRGKVLVTDRLHGHILAVLLDMPTVIIDNHIHKLSHYRDTWTRGLSNVVMATDANDAVQKAMDMLEKFT